MHATLCFRPVAVLLASLFIALSTHAQTPDSSDGKTVTVSGTVISSADNLPIVGANVYIEGADPKGSAFVVLKDCEVAVGRFFQSFASLHPPFRLCRQGAAHKAAAGHALELNLRLLYCSF